MVQVSDQDTPLYTVAAISRRSGVAAVTLRAWERRYGFPSPQRAPGGRRLYTDRDLESVIALRAQTAQGVPISRAIALLVGRPAADAALHSTAHLRTEPLERFHSRLLAALLDLAPRRAETALSEALATLSVEDVCLGLIQPVINELGVRTESGAASITREHFASAFVRARLATLFAAYAIDDVRPKVLAACPPGEWHELGLLMVCLFLARDGVSVRYLGANLPAHELAAVVVELRPAMVFLSAQTQDTAEQLITALQLVEALGSPGPLRAYGGWIFNQCAELRERTPGTFLGENACVAAARAVVLLGGTRG
ncbi:MAG: MerR family transcriptional regulator [Chloroflexota bacterium]